MRAAFIPALPPSALLAGMIAPSFRLVNRFCGKKLLRTCGRHERPHALCAVWARSPLAYVKGSLPFDRSLWHRPSLRRTQAARAFRAPIWRKKRASPHPATVPAGPCFLSQSAKAPLHAPAPAAVGASPRPPLAPWVRASPAPAAVPAGPCFLSQSAETPLHAPAPAAVGASPRPPLAPWVRASPAPASRKRFECPKDTRNAPRRTAPLATPGLPPAPAVGRFGGLTGPPNAFVSPGFAGRAGSLRPRKHSLRRPPPGEPAALPPAK